MNESGIDFEQLAASPRKDQESLHGKKIDRPTLKEIERSTTDPELKRTINYLSVYSTLGPSEAKTIQLTKFFGDLIDNLARLKIETQEPGADATQDELAAYEAALEQYADINWILHEIIDPQLRSTSRPEQVSPRPVDPQENERQKASKKIEQIGQSLDSLIQDQVKQQQLQDIETAINTVGRTFSPAELNSFESTLQQLLEELNTENAKLQVVRGGLENRYKNQGDTDAQDLVQDIDRKYGNNSELNKLRSRLESSLFKIWQLKIPADFPQHYELVDELTYVEPNNGSLKDQLDQRFSDINALQTKIDTATSESMAKANSLQDDRQKYLGDEFIEKAKTQLDHRKNQAFEFFKREVQNIFPALRDLRIATEVVENNGVVGDPTQALDILRQQLTLSEAEFNAQNFPESRYKDFVNENFLRPASDALMGLSSAKDKYNENQRNNLDVNFLNIEYPNAENAFRWLRTQIAILESNFNLRFDANANLYNDVQAKIARLKGVEPDLGSQLEAEFGARGALHNDYRSHMIDKQAMKVENIDNPDLYAPHFKHFYHEMNSEEQGVPVAHARRLLSRAFQGRLLGAEISGDEFIDAATYPKHDDFVREVVIRRLIDESGNGNRPDGTPYKKVSREQAELAVKIADRLATIEHERALQDYQMKQTEPDKYRDYMHFPERQLYYRGKDRTSATFIASVYLFAEPKVVEKMRQAVNPSFAPLVLQPPRARDIEIEVDHSTGKVQFTQKGFEKHWKNPGYSFVGDLYSFAETKKDKPKEIIFDRAESRWRFKLLSDVVSSNADRDPLFGYQLAEGERMHEEINWDDVDPRLFKLWINQLFNVKKATDDFFVEKDISSRKLETIEFYEDLATPIDYTMATTYRIRDTEIGLGDVASIAGLANRGLLDALKRAKADETLNHEQKARLVEQLLADPQFEAYLNAQGIREDEARVGLLTLFVTKKEMRIRMQEIVMLGFVYANHVNKNPGLHERWDEANDQEVSEILEVAVQAGFITHEGEKWIKDAIPKLSIAFKEMMHGVATRARKEGL